MVANSANKFDFVGIKVGDVNNSVVAHRPGDRPVTTLSWPELRAKKGGFVTLPITYTGADTLEAVQLGLRYDPSALQLISPSLGELPAWGPGNFNLAVPGEIRTLWLPSDPGDPEQLLAPGKVMFYLTFKVLTEIPSSGLPLLLDDQLLDNAAWQPKGTELSLQKVAAGMRDQVQTAETGLVADCFPNPGTGAPSFSLNAPKEGKARIAVYSPFGVRLVALDVELSKGTQQFTLEEAAKLPAGVYVWKVISKNGKAQGHWVKQ